MKLRQKLFAAILAVMVVVFLMLALASFQSALEAQEVKRDYVQRLENVAVAYFREAVLSDSVGRWTGLAARLKALDMPGDWTVRHGGRVVLKVYERDTSWQDLLAGEWPYSIWYTLRPGSPGQRLDNRVKVAAVRLFRRDEKSRSKTRWSDLASELRKLRGAHSWTVKRGTEVILHVESSHGGETALASEGEFVLARTPRAAGVQLFRWLPGIFWAMTAGTAFLMLVIYGLLLRLVLRPVDNLVAASRGLSKGVRPPKVTGESRTDEMGELIRAFNSMAEEVVTGRDALRELVEKATADYRRAHEQLVIEQRLSATGKLAAGVAHEISNPLGGMINAARAIEKEEGLSERAREYVGLINDGLARVRDIVERMRTFVRPKPAVGPVDVAEAVKGAISFARHRVKDEGVELEEDYPDSLLRTVGDAGELQQVFLNLIMNALDAVKESETKRVRVRVVGEESNVVAEIADTGAGMTPEQLANAFDLFYSTKDISAEGEGGTGLGLAIAHKIVTDHGGEIELESSPGKGTVARVRLPAEGERE